MCRRSGSAFCQGFSATPPPFVTSLTPRWKCCSWIEDEHGETTADNKSSNWVGRPGQRRHVRGIASQRRLQQVPAWDRTAESAELRVCALMNASVTEIDMFRLAPEQNWPESFWIPQLEKFVAGGGCIVKPPPDH
jgi:hypothetical protein